LACFSLPQLPCLRGAPESARVRGGRKEELRRGLEYLTSITSPCPLLGKEEWKKFFIQKFPLLSRSPSHD